jgi:hypothetical protein
LWLSIRSQASKLAAHQHWTAQNINKVTKTETSKLTISLNSKHPAVFPLKKENFQSHLPFSFHVNIIVISTATSKALFHIF